MNWQKSGFVRAGLIFRPVLSGPEPDCRVGLTFRPVRPDQSPIAGLV
jgi:hypothetical protein